MEQTRYIIKKMMFHFFHHFRESCSMTVFKPPGQIAPASAWTPPASSSTDAIAVAVAASAGRLRQLERQRHLAARLDRLALAARCLGAERRLGPRFPARLPVRMTAGGLMHLTLTVDVGLNGMMVDRPAGFEAPVGFPVTIANPRLGRIAATVVAIDATTLSLKLDHDGAEPSRCLLQHLVGQLHQDAASLLPLAQRFASAIADAFSDAVRTRRMPLETLLSGELSRLPGTDPPQYDHPASPLYEELLPSILARFHDPARGMVYAVATDRNGFVPVHNPAFAQAQRRNDPVFNHNFSRDRRIYDDRWTLRAARFARSPLVQAYRRDTAQRFGALVRDVSAPVLVMNRRWGAAQIGYAMEVDR
jgi:methyl-accepting chemotaxis protein